MSPTVHRACAIVLLGLVAGCTRRVEGAKAGDPATLIAAAPETDEVVATVDGRSIHASDVATQAKAAGTDAKTALAALVDAEVLVTRAQAGGLLLDPDVIDARKAALGRRLLATVFEKNVTPDKIPEAEFRKAYELHHADFEHGEGVELWHLVASAKLPGATPEQRRRARERLVALRPKAIAATSDAAFAALADEHPAEGEIPVKAEHFATPRRGLVEDAFADAAFALTRPGEVSGIVETSYGYHLIRFVRRVPARHFTLEDAKVELRDKIFPDWQRREFDHYLRDLSAGWHAEENAARLAAAAAASPEAQ